MEPAKAISEYKSQLEAKDEEIDQLHKALGKTTIEKDWAVKKLKSLDYKTKKLLIKSELNISLQGQCNMLEISRSSFYYTPKPMSAYNLQILNSIDEIYTDNGSGSTKAIAEYLSNKNIIVKCILVKPFS